MENLTNPKNNIEDNIIKLKETKGMTIKDISDWISFINSNISTINQNIKNKTPEEINHYFDNQDNIIEFSSKWDFKDILLHLSKQLRIKSLDWNITNNEIQTIINESIDDINKLQKIMIESMHQIQKITQNNLINLKTNL